MIRKASFFFVLCTIFNGLCGQVFIDFFEGLKTHKNLNRQTIDKSEFWQLSEYLYKKYILNGSCSDEMRIPQIIHHVWLGSKLPDVSDDLRKTWIAYNPGWIFILWTDNSLNHEYGCVVYSFDELHRVLNEGREQFVVFDIGGLNLKNHNAFSITKNYGERSDILRYEVLYEFGGLYVDTDFECLKPFDVFHHYCDFYTGISYSKKFSFLNGLIGASVHNPILKYCIDDLKKGSGSMCVPEIIQRTGPRHLTRSFFKAIAEGYDGRAVGFPTLVFYPCPNWLNEETNVNKMKAWIQPESFAVHYWHTSWW